MERGSAPEVSVAQLYPQPELKNAMKEYYLNNTEGDSTCFGVIIGSSGIGNNCVKRILKACTITKSMNPNFVSGLVEELGMKIKPTSVFDLMLEYISSRYCHYHRVPDCVLACEAKISYLNQLLLDLHSSAELWLGINNILGRYHLRQNPIDTALSLDDINSFFVLLQLLLNIIQLPVSVP